MFSAVPLLYRWIAIGLLLAAFGGWCFVKGLNWSRAEHEAFVSKVETEGRVAQERAAERTREANEITQRREKEHAQNTLTLYDYYEQRLAGMRDKRTRGSPVPPLPGPSSSVNAVPPDVQTPPAELAREIQRLRTEIGIIEEAAAKTTLDLLELQAWIKEQERNTN